MQRLQTTLADKYTASDGCHYLTGIQALVRLPVQQRMRDAAAGWNTGGYISGYRGSPLGRYDIELRSAEKTLKHYNIQFRTGLNEDLAAAAIWGSQYVGSFPGAEVDGVFGIWYGKGPGVDRSGDALRHANLAGTSTRGGVLALAGDDHGAKSSTVANFSDQIFIAVGMPLLYPSNTQEILDYGLHGIAMSRYSGCWIGMKVVTDVVEGGGSVDVDVDRPLIQLPPSESTYDHLGIRLGDMPLPQEARLYDKKLNAALDYARLNKLNYIVDASTDATVGIISSGKAWQDVQQATTALKMDASASAKIRQLKIGMVWPLDPMIVREFSTGLSTIIIIEEKRPLLEDQVRTILYGRPEAPAIIGKYFSGSQFDPERRQVAFPNSGELSPAFIARLLAQTLSPMGFECHLPESAVRLASASSVQKRAPGFCSGCPHNRSTKVVEGSRALAGIGCHTMAMLMNPKQTTTVSHMGAEGVMWLGQQAFTKERHVFANIGDGTYSHSGFLAIRQAVAANVPITYKLLYNGFVSMTGGQSVETGQSPAQVLHALAAEGVKKMAVVADDVSRYDDVVLPQGVTIHPRTSLEAVQRDFRTYPGVSLILYDQVCATELRRLRKRKQRPDPVKRTFINAAVCEGCGDCGKASNCMSVEPLETTLGRKRRINQESCNKDFSCIEGFCPSFVTVHGATLRGAVPLVSLTQQMIPEQLPEPPRPELTRPFNVLIGGIGGTGVVTVGQTLAVAAHLSGHYSSNLDVTGLSQKYGEVHSHVRFAPNPALLHATRIGEGECHVLIGCDLLVAAGAESMSKLLPQDAFAVVNSNLVPTTEFARNPDWRLDTDTMSARLREACGERLLLLNATKLCQALLGDSVAANIFMLGAAWQWGRIPLSLQAIERAIELNGMAIDLNQKAFTLGRRAAHDLQSVERMADGGQQPAAQRSDEPQSTATIVADRSKRLMAHTGAKLAQRFESLVSRMQSAEARSNLDDALSSAVAHNYHRLLGVKDEWEVARLYSEPEFKASLDKEFEGNFTMHFHIGSWPFARRDRETGVIQKAELGQWAWDLMKLMSRMRVLRGSWLDPFRRGDERILDRQLLEQFEADIGKVIEGLNSDNAVLAMQIASLPQQIRGYGHVRVANAAIVEAKRTALWKEWRQASVGIAV